MFSTCFFYRKTARKLRDKRLFCGCGIQPQTGRKGKTIINEKMQVIKITTDLIIHSRGDLQAEDENLIAIEVKKSFRPKKEKADDVARLLAMTKKPNEDVWSYDGAYPEHVCGYSLGVFMEIVLDSQEVRLRFFKNREEYKQNRFPFFSTLKAHNNAK